MIKQILKLYYKLPCRPFRKQLAWAFNKYRKKDLNRIVLAERKDLNFELDLKDRVQSGIYYDFYEPIITKLFEKKLNRGDNVIDVGANIGYYSLLSAKQVGDSGKVYSFEPMSSAYKKLVNHIEINSFTNIFPNKKAVGNKNEKICAFFENEYKVGVDEKGEKEEIEVITIDSFVKEIDLKSLKLLKIDTDGYDFKVLQGAINTIKQFKPIVTLEISPDEPDTDEFLTFIFENLDNYNISSDVGGKIREYNKTQVRELLNKRGIINLLCFPK